MEDFKPRNTGETEKKEDIITFGENPFTKEDIDREWQAFAKKLSESGASDSQNMLLKQPYKLDGSIIVLTLSNAFQQDILLRFNIDLVTHLRKSLDNRNIDVKAIVSEIIRTDTPYTNQDKFEYLMRIKPELKVLKEKFDLDPDF
ncbi:MAG: hypothetical protein OEW75_16915 [Cyclobacteriaceae bacterium]|nr:hypothetical protein [Cyclobacteriaceae bacterium]